MASIRKRGSSYLIVVSMGYDYNGKRINPRQKTVHPPEELTPRQVEKWLNEQAVLFERDCRHTPQPVQQLTLAKYIDLWLTDIAPGKLAKSTIRRDRQDIERILPALGHYKLTELRPEHFQNFYAELRKVIRPDTKKPLSECTIEGVHATLCSILSDAVEGGFLSHNPAWRTYRYAGRKCEKKIADEETAQRIIAALEGESIKYETYFKLIIATGMRRGECCGLKWCDIDWEQRSIHICRNAVKVTDEDTLNCKVEIRFLIIFNVSPYCLFPDDENRKFSVYYMELAPGSHWQSEPHLRGTTEFVTLFAGAIEITADQKTIVVQASESVRFQGDTTHAYRNISDQTTILHMILYNP